VKDWQQFVIEHGAGMRSDLLAFILGRAPAEVAALRRRRVCRPGPTRVGNAARFAQLFQRWHGRPPAEEDWPTPRRIVGRRSDYEWFAPEHALLASLVGHMSPAEIAEVLTARLRKVTQDPRACRTKQSVLNAIQRIGLQTLDVIGGIRLSDAGREIRSYGSVLHAVERGDLPSRRVGRYVVIPHEAWAQWKAARPQPPADYVRLAPIFRRLGISSDSKPQEFAMHVPTAQQFHPFGERGGTSRRGVWFIKESVARQLIADRRAGRPMPWHGKPNPSNLKSTWPRLQTRRHPPTCQECRRIWGGAPPTSFDEFVRRYPPLSLGDKRHLTRRWNPGVTVKELARELRMHPVSIAHAIRRGALRAKKVGNSYFITRTDATRWKARHFPSGDGQHSWIAGARARDYYGFSAEELEAFVRQGRLKTKPGPRGRLLFARQQCRDLREEIGYTERQAASRCGLTVQKFWIMCRGLDVGRRAAHGIKPDLVRNVQRRLAHLPGIPLDQAASKVGKPVHWIRYQLQLGRIEVVRAPWDHKSLYVTKATIERLRRLAAAPERRPARLGADWLMLQEAARHAGVCTTQVLMWKDEGAVRCRRGLGGLRYARQSVEARARRHWARPRLKRATPPAWLQPEKEAA